MKEEIPFSKDIALAFKNEPPGTWLLDLPEGCIRLSSGYPEPLLVPVEGVKAAVVRLFDEEGDLPLQYKGSPRIPKLSAMIQERMATREVHVTEKELLVTAGACQAIDLIARVLLDAKSVVAIEAPTYMEALEVFRNYTEHFMNVPVDEHGMDTERFEEMLANRRREGLTLPRVLYAIPTSQNPTGTTLTQERRERLLELAEEYGFLILEDDAYGELNFGDAPRLLKAMDKGDRVLYIGSLSKVVAPGMRIGWVAGAEKIIATMNWFKKDLHHPFAQAAMTTFLEGVDFNEHVKELSAAYKQKCEVMTTALEKFLPPAVTWYTPEGGYFVWVKIPGVDTMGMLPEALGAGVSYVPGNYFFQSPESKEFLRLSFSYATGEEIVKGVELLGEVAGRNI